MFLKLPDWLIYDIKHKWEQLEIKKWINENPKVVFIVTGCSMLLFLVLLISFLRSSTNTVSTVKIEKEWYYDLNTGKLFVAQVGQTPPIEAPSGPLPNGMPAGIRAYVFSYSLKPDKQSERFIGFLETADSNAGTISNDIKRWEHGKLIRTIEDANWYQADSPEGRAILQNIFSPNEKGPQPYYYPPE